MIEILHLGNYAERSVSWSLSVHQERFRAAAECDLRETDELWYREGKYLGRHKEDDQEEEVVEGLHTGLGVSKGPINLSSFIDLSSIYGTGQLITVPTATARV